MLPNISLSIALFFGLTTLFCLFLVYNILKSSLKTQKKALSICAGFVIWMVIQAIITLKSVYLNNSDAFPPRIIIFGVFPMLVFIIVLFILPQTRKIIDSLSITSLLYLNMVRIPVEIALYVLFLNKTIPEIMTFEGRNFDILAGLTAPLMVFFYKKGLSPKLLLAWHFAALILLVNIVFTAIFSTPSPFQKFGFEQPNIAILSFPISWLPTFIVPIVLFGHLASIRILSKKFEKYK